MDGNSQVCDSARRLRSRLAAPSRASAPFPVHALVMVHPCLSAAVPIADHGRLGAMLRDSPMTTISLNTVHPARGGPHRCDRRGCVRPRLDRSRPTAAVSDEAATLRWPDDGGLFLASRGKWV